MTDIWEDRPEVVRGWSRLRLHCIRGELSTGWRGGEVKFDWTKTPGAKAKRRSRDRALRAIQSGISPPFWVSEARRAHIRRKGSAIPQVLSSVHNAKSPNHLRRLLTVEAIYQQVSTIHLQSTLHSAKVSLLLPRDAVPSPNLEPSRTAAWKTIGDAVGSGRLGRGMCAGRIQLLVIMLPGLQDLDAHMFV